MIFLAQRRELGVVLRDGTAEVVRNSRVLRHGPVDRSDFLRALRRVILLRRPSIRSIALRRARAEVTLLPLFAKFVLDGERRQSANAAAIFLFLESFRQQARLHGKRIERRKGGRDFAGARRRQVTKEMVGTRPIRLLRAGPEVQIVRAIGSHCDTGGW